MVTVQQDSVSRLILSASLPLLSWLHLRISLSLFILLLLCSEGIITLLVASEAMIAIAYPAKNANVEGC